MNDSDTRMMGIRFLVMRISDARRQTVTIERRGVLMETALVNNTLLIID